MEENYCPVWNVQCGNGSVSLRRGLGAGPTVVSLVSCCLSCLGSLLIMATYAAWRDIRTGSRSIITFLAAADFVTAAGYIMGGANYLYRYHHRYSGTCELFLRVCELQSFITSWSSLSSFVWTSVLGLYLYLTIAHSRVFLAARLVPISHLLAWAGPIPILLPLLLTNRLGYSHIAASNWCYIKGSADRSSGGLETLLLFVAGKGWEILTYIAVILLYTAIKCHIYKETRQFSSSSSLTSCGVVAAVQRVDRKLIFIPVVFILLRMWGTFQMFYGFGVSHYVNDGGCIARGWYVGFLVLGYLQAAGDGGQGWGNVILYLFVSRKMRTRLWGCLRLCLWRVKGWRVHWTGPTALLIGSPTHDAPPTPKPPAALPTARVVKYVSGQDTVSVDYEPTTIIND